MVFRGRVGIHSSSLLRQVRGRCSPRSPVALRRAEMMADGIVVDVHYSARCFAAALPLRVLQELTDVCAQVERGDPTPGALGSADGAERGGRVHSRRGASCQRRSHRRSLPAQTGVVDVRLLYLRFAGWVFRLHFLSTEETCWCLVWWLPLFNPPPPSGSVPSCPGGGPLRTGLGHHAPRRCLHRLRVHRRRQSPTDLQRITTGLCWTSVSLVGN